MAIVQQDIFLQQSTSEFGGECLGNLGAISAHSDNLKGHSKSFCCCGGVLGCRNGRRGQRRLNSIVTVEELQDVLNDHCYDELWLFSIWL